MRHQSRLIMVRHGQTTANVERVWHGITDTPLTELGREQAERLGTYFHRVMDPHVIYASPLQRAHQTALAIARRHHLEVNVDARLAEFSLGEWEGTRFDILTEQLDVEHRLYRDPAFMPPGGESQLIVRERMVAALEEIVTRHPAENVVIVSHGVAMGIAFSHYLHDDTTRWMSYTKHNTGFSEFCPVRREMVFFNRIDHLDSQNCP